jgi:CRP-like cAMP-binding protein
MVIERLGRQEIFEFLRPEQVDALSNAAELIKFKAGDTVYQKGDEAKHFFIVLNGQVALRLPGKESVSIPIDQLSGGTMFGSCVSAAMGSYSLTAQCTEDSELLKIGAVSLKNLLDDDPRMGYAIQSKISEIYFNRYIETMKKLQSIVMNIPIESAG